MMEIFKHRIRAVAVWAHPVRRSRKWAVPEVRTPRKPREESLRMAERCSLGETWRHFRWRWQPRICVREVHGSCIGYGVHHNGWNSKLQSRQIALLVRIRCHLSICCSGPWPACMLERVILHRYPTLYPPPHLPFPRKLFSNSRSTTAFHFSTFMPFY